jgi:hypothetical protein
MARARQGQWPTRRAASRGGACTSGRSSVPAHPGAWPKWTDIRLVQVDAHPKWTAIPLVQVGAYPKRTGIRLVQVDAHPKRRAIPLVQVIAHPKRTGIRLGRVDAHPNATDIPLVQVDAHPKWTGIRLSDRGLSDFSMHARWQVHRPLHESSSAPRSLSEGSPVEAVDRERAFSCARGSSRDEAGLVYPSLPGTPDGRGPLARRSVRRSKQT